MEVDKFFNDDKVEFRCECGNVAECNKTIFVLEFPKFIWITLKRFTSLGSKLNQKVIIPENELIIQDVKFELISIVVILY